MNTSLKNSTLICQQAYFAGSWRGAASGKTFAVTNPATGDLIAEVPSLGAAEVEEAICFAQLAMQSWQQTSCLQRAAILRRWNDLLLANIDDLALLLTLEQGKPLAEARAEIQYGASYLEWFAEEAKRIYGETIPAPSSDRRIIVLPQPVGLCAAITPWNFPNAMITRKVGPALAAGCAMLVKPASATPLSALALAKLAEEAGLPPGLFSVLTGSAGAIGDVLVKSPVVRKLSFTGSTEVGKILMRECAATVKKVTMELGGNAPFIVFPDADLAAAVEGLMAAKFRNSGQTCVCVNRVLVAEPVREKFLELLRPAVAALKVGPGTEAAVQQGPLIDEGAVEKVEELIGEAIGCGASVSQGGSRHELGGTFFQPTILEGCTADMQLAREEIFGPVAAVFSFQTEAEAIALANATEVGLASYFYGRDIGQIWRVAEALEYGMVGINTGMISNAMAPFGGIKESGLGREGSRHGIADYLNLKYLCLAGLDR
jgi:succinate-semialdehyde dehydrogenase / glutarate-semialdehyde dehydrogenase